MSETNEDSGFGVEGVAFPTVRWQLWDCDASFVGENRLPPSSGATLYAVLAFVFYGDRVALADIQGRGYCIPSGKIEPGESAMDAVVREIYEETGARISRDRIHPIGWYRMVPLNPDSAAEDRVCPVFITEADGFADIPAGSESKGIMLAAVEDVAELYFMWDGLMASVFDYADRMRIELLKPGVSLSDFMAEK